MSKDVSSQPVFRELTYRPDRVSLVTSSVKDLRETIVSIAPTIMGMTSAIIDECLDSECGAQGVGNRRTLEPLGLYVYRAGVVCARASLCGSLCPLNVLKDECP